MRQTLASTLMDTTLRLEGLANNIQHSNFLQCRVNGHSEEEEEEKPTVTYDLAAARLVKTKTV